MINISPISETSASDKISQIYVEIKTTLELPSIPYYFQIIANSEFFLDFLWQKLSPVVSSPDFDNLIIDATNYTLGQLRKVKPTSPMLTIFLRKLSEGQVHAYKKEFFELARLNCIFMTLSIIVREAIKGLATVSEVREHFKLTSLEEKQSLEERFSEAEKIIEKNALASISKDLAIPQGESDPYFFTFIKIVSEIMENFFKTNDYLQIRLLSENKFQELVKALPTKLDLPYGQMLEILQKESFANELIFLLYDLLPGYYPKQFIAALLLTVSLETNLEITGSQKAFSENDQKLLN